MKIAGKQLSPPASAEEIKRLRASLPVGVPEDYFSFLEASNGGDVWFDEVDHQQEPFDYIRIFPADMTNLTVKSEWPKCALPHLLVIGGDAASQLLAYDMSLPNWPIVMHLPGWSEAEGAFHVAGSIRELSERYCLCSAPSQE